MKDIRRAGRAPSDRADAAGTSAGRPVAGLMAPGRRRAPSPPSRPARGARQVVADYFELTKPKVQTLLLLTTVDDDVRRRRSRRSGWSSLTCLGGYLSAGGAGAVNHWFDRDIDAQMARTANRPVPAGPHRAARRAEVRHRARGAVVRRAAR